MSLLSEGNARIQHDLCAGVLVSPSVIFLVTCYYVAIHLDLCSMPVLCGSPWPRNVGWLELGTETDRLTKSFGKQRPHQAWTECQACAADKMIRVTVWLEGYSRKFGPAKPSFQNGSSLLPCRCRLLEVCSETDCSVQKYLGPEGELINSMPFVNW